MTEKKYNSIRHEGLELALIKELSEVFKENLDKINTLTENREYDEAIVKASVLIGRLASVQHGLMECKKEYIELNSPCGCFAYCTCGKTPGDAP